VYVFFCTGVYYLSMPQTALLVREGDCIGSKFVPIANKTNHTHMESEILWEVLCALFPAIIIVDLIDP
jgi:hypothetical protein